jgi:hypothetical protein
MKTFAGAIFHWMFSAIAVLVLAGPSFGTTLNSVPVGAYNALVLYAPPCCVLSILDQDTTGRRNAFGTGSLDGGTWSYIGYGNALSTVGWASTLPLQLDPFVQAQAQDSISGQIPSSFGPTFETGASLKYYVGIASINPAQTSLPNDVLNLQVHGSAITNGTAEARAYMLLDGTTFGSAHVTSAAGGTNGDSFDFNGFLTLNTNTVYEVFIAASSTSYGLSGDNSASAFVDPIFTIAAPYQSQYQLLLSPDLQEIAGLPSAVPESSSLEYILTALLLGSIWRRFGANKKLKVFYVLR